MAERLNLQGRRRKGGGSTREERSDYAPETNAGVAGNINEEIGGTWVDAVHAYIHEGEWSTTVQTFCESHCTLFSRHGGGNSRNPIHSDEYDNKTYSCFNDFKNMAEQMLEGLLDRLGASPEGFVQVLERYTCEPSSGPREDQIKDLLSQLLLLDPWCTHWCGVQHSKLLKYCGDVSWIGFIAHALSSPANHAVQASNFAKKLL